MVETGRAEAYIAGQERALVPGARGARAARVLHISVLSVARARKPVSTTTSRNRYFESLKL